MKLNLENYVIAVAAITSFFAVFLSSGVIVAVPSIATEFGMSNIVQNWIATIFLLLVAIFTIPAGQLSGKFGLKKSLVLGLFVYLLSSIGTCLAFSTEVFLIFRIIQGIGVAFINVAAMAMVVSAVSPKNRGKALGLTVTGVYMATSLSPVIGGSLTYYFGWRAIFYFVIPFLLVCIILMLVKIPQEWKTGENDPIDKIGSIIYGIGILFFIYGFTRLKSSIGATLAILGAILLIGFVLWELKEKYPVFNMRLFKNAKFASSNLAAFCGYLAVFVVTTILSYHLQYVRGMNSQVTGLFLIVTPIVMAILAPIAGKLSDKIYPQKLAAIGMAIGSVALGIFAFLNNNTSFYVIIIAMLLQGMGVGLFSSPNTNSMMSSFPAKETSTASASVATMRTIGQTMSLGMLTLIFAFVMGNVPIIPKYYPLLITSSQIACGISTILCVASVFASLVGIKSKDKFTTETN